MTDRELMKMALDALQEVNKLSIGEKSVCLPAEIDDAMDALRERLSQPEPYDQAELELCDVCGWKTVVPDEGCLNCKRLSQPEYEFECPRCGHCCQQREWVGLTDEEWIKELGVIREQISGDVFGSFYRAIEAKLKEKNACIYVN